MVFPNLLLFTLTTNLYPKERLLRSHQLEKLIVMVPFINS